MNKKNILIVFILVIFISSVYAINTDEFAKAGKEKALGAACKSKQGESACQAYNALKDPTGKLLGELGPQAQQLISGIQNPLGAGKEAVMNKLMQSLQENNPELASAFNFYNAFQKYRGKFDGFFGKEEGNRYEPYYDEQSKEFGATRDGKPYFVATEGVNINVDENNEITGAVITVKEQPIELKTTEDRPKISFSCDVNVCKKVTANGFEILNLVKGDKIEFSEDPKNGIKNFKVLNGEIDLKINGKPIGEPKGEINNGEFRLKNDVLEYAKFNSVRDGKYSFNYNKVDYKFDVSKGGEVLFNPTNLKIGGKKLKDFKLDGKLLEGDFEVNFGNKDLKSIRKIFFDKSGKYIDTDKGIVTTSPLKFTICLTSYDSEKTNLNGVSGGACEGENYLWFNGGNLNFIKTAGKIDYGIGKYLRVDSTKSGAKTTYVQTPIMDDFFEVSEGGAIIEKDEIRSWVEYKGKCNNKITGKIVSFAIKILEIKDTSKIRDGKNKPCGLFVETFRTGIPKVATQRVNIIDPDNRYDIKIGSTGTLSAIDLTTLKDVGGVYRNYKNANEEFYFSNLVDIENKKSLFFGEYIMNDEKTALSLLKEMKLSLTHQKDALNRKLIDNLAIKIPGTGKSYADLKSEAQNDIENKIKSIDGAMELIEKGYPLSKALKEERLNNEYEGQILTNTINEDGTINTKKLIELSKKRIEETDGCFSTNLYQAVGDCLGAVHTSLDLSKHLIYTEHNILEESGKQTIIGYLMEEKKLSFDESLRASKTVLGLPFEGVGVTIKGALIRLPDKKFTVKEIKEDITRIETIIKDDERFKDIKEVQKEIDGAEKWKEVGISATEFANMIDVATLPVDVISVVKLGSKLNLIKNGIRLNDVKALREYKALSKSMEYLKAGAESDLFKQITKGKSSIKEMDDIPKIASELGVVCL